MTENEFLIKKIELFIDYPLIINGNLMTFELNNRFRLIIDKIAYFIDDFVNEESYKSSLFQDGEQLLDELIIFKELSLQKYLNYDKDEYIRKLKLEYNPSPKFDPKTMFGVKPGNNHHQSLINHMRGI